jgi:hypothetical protein
VQHQEFIMQAQEFAKALIAGYYNAYNPGQSSPASEEDIPSIAAAYQEDLNNGARELTQADINELFESPALWSERAHPNLLNVIARISE